MSVFQVNRRTFLRSTAASLASLTTWHELAAVELPAGAIDAHTHFYDPTRPQGVPWPGKNDKVLYRPVLPGEFTALTRKHGVSGTIVVEASPWVEDNQWLLDLAAREPIIVGVVGRLDPAAEEFPKLLDRFSQQALFRGIRVSHADLKKGLDQPTFLQNLRRLARLDRTLDANGGSDLPADVARLAQAVPDLRIVINHAANLKLDGQPPPAAWLAGMKAAAAQPKVFCKVSALVEATGKTQRDAPAAVAFYRPALDALSKLFGADRLLYGSNWPVSERAAPYATVFGIVQAYFAAQGQETLAKFLRGNALTVYKPVARAQR